jgi:hypothetical protein
MTPVDLTREELIEALSEFAWDCEQNAFTLRDEGNDTASDDLSYKSRRIRAALAKLEEGE